MVRPACCEPYLQTWIIHENWLGKDPHQPKTSRALAIISKPFCNVSLPRLPLRSNHPMGCEGCLHSSKATKRRQVASRPAWYAWPYCPIYEEVLIFLQDCRSSAAFGIFRVLIAISVSSSGQTSMVRSIRSTSLESIMSGWHQTRLHKTFW